MKLIHVWKIGLIGIVLIGTFYFAAIAGVSILEILKKDLFIFGFYILILLLFKDELNLDRVGINSINKFGMIIVSAYLSYLAFIEIGLPGFISIIAGISFVLAFRKLVGLICKIKNKEVNAGFSFTIFLFVILIFIAALDMSMSGVNFVLSEGKQITRFKVLEKKETIDKLKVQEQQLKILDELVKNGNYANARFHSDRFSKIMDPDSNQVSTKIMGNLRQGFTDVLGNEQDGRKATMWFIIIVSFSITALVGTNEVEEHFTKIKNIKYEPNYLSGSNSVQTGSGAIGFQFKSDESVIERSNEKQIPISTKFKMFSQRLFKSKNKLGSKTIPQDQIEHLKKLFYETGRSDDTILYLWNNGFSKNKSQIGRWTGELLNREKPVSASYTTRVINKHGEKL